MDITTRCWDFNLHAVWVFALGGLMLTGPQLWGAPPLRPTADVKKHLEAAPVLHLAQRWSFGVMGDTQWSDKHGDKTYHSTAVGLIHQVNQAFKSHGVAFVIQVGDLSDRGGDKATRTTAEARQELLEAGIGFFPIRGNHDKSPQTARSFLDCFPQTQNGEHLIPGSPARRLTLGKNFSSPSPARKGLSYAFDYNNLRLLLLDEFPGPDGSPCEISTQLPWIQQSLSQRPPKTHALVFAHRGLVMECHEDSLFGEDPSQNPKEQNTFIQTLVQNNVPFLIVGHDHLHSHSLVSTTDGRSSLQQLICASCSHKFYFPPRPSVDEQFNLPAFGRRRQIPLGQETSTIGYYLVTLNGPQLTVDFYSAPVNPEVKKNHASLKTTPDLVFTHKARLGGSLQGKSFLLQPGQPFKEVQDRALSLLHGTHIGSIKDERGRALSHLVHTGWSPATQGLKSDICSLWGLGTPVSNASDFRYVVSFSYDPKSLSDQSAQSGQWGIATPGPSHWINAATAHCKAQAKFILGPWEPQHLKDGYYGLDLKNHRFWAVINFSGDFALAPLTPK